MALVGGPRHRWWYFLPDAEQLRASLRSLGRELPYRPTGKHVLHPTYAATGVAWRWTGAPE